MDIRPLDRCDLPAVLDLTITTFEPFYENAYRPVVGDVVFHNRHGHWRDDYRAHVAGLHDPSRGRYAALAWSGALLCGFVAWVSDREQRHGEIDLLAVSTSQRGHGYGRRLAQHALDAMAADGVEMVSIGTGGDPFHAPARSLYASLGFTPYPNVIYTKAV